MASEHPMTVEGRIHESLALLAVVEAFIYEQPGIELVDRDDLERGLGHIAERVRDLLAPIKEAPTTVLNWMPSKEASEAGAR